MLEVIPTNEASLRIFRLATQPTLVDFLEEQGLDEHAIREMEELLQSRGITDTLEELCDAPFRLKRSLKKANRFSDSSFPVFYSSLETDTAKAETCHHFLKFVGRPKEPRTAYYVCFSCQFNGSAKDLRPMLEAWPELIDDDYQFCNELGAEAVELQLDGLLSPSARNEDGTNVPVFTRASISNPHETASVAVTYDPSSDVASYREN